MDRNNDKTKSLKVLTAGESKIYFDQKSELTRADPVKTSIHPCRQEMIYVRFTESKEIQDINKTGQIDSTLRSFLYFGFGIERDPKTRRGQHH